MAVEDSDGDDEVVILSNSGSPSHGYMAVKASPSKPGKGRGVMSPQLRRSAASAIMRDSPPPIKRPAFHVRPTHEPNLTIHVPGLRLVGTVRKVPIQALGRLFGLGT